MSWPIPEGLTASSSAPFDSVATANATFSDGGNAVLTFQPVDPNNPGVATLYDSGNNALVTMNQGGYAAFYIPTGGGTYYWKATLGANIVAITLTGNQAR